MASVRCLVGRCPRCGASVFPRQSRATSNFPPNRVVVVRKSTRLEYQKERLKLQTEKDLQNWIGSEYETLVQNHSEHHRNVEIITNFLESQGVEVRLRDRNEYSEEDVEWADSVFSAGGDGNLLWAASKVFSPDKLVVGFNSDPLSSVGFLCINSSRFPSLLHSLKAVFRGEVPLYRRARIRVKVGEYILPVRALNEVFVGERSQSRAAYYELSVDGCASERQRSSGVLVYTGTGSTSWAYNVNQLTAEKVETVLELYRQRVGKLQDGSTPELAAEIAKECNSRGVYAGSHMGLSFVVREPIIHNQSPVQHILGTASSVSVRPLNWSTELTIDGTSHFCMEGGVATCLLHPQDVLTTLYHVP